MICVARFSADGAWYRARVVGLAGARRVRVQYVDFGNVETISHWKMRKILDDFLVLPEQVGEGRVLRSAKVAFSGRRRSRLVSEGRVLWSVKVASSGR